MDRRTFEGPMEWEYQNRGPFDPTSPFTHAAQGGGLQNGFASPVKESVSSRPNPFATPSKPQHGRPLFTPQQPGSRSTAAPFRNPAFTTPRKPFDDLGLSEASAAEESPAVTETSEIPNDTPEADRMSDVHMGGTITPSKVDKATRYQKGGAASRKHASGKGEIRPHRERSLGALTRRRAKHSQEREINGWIQRQYHDSAEQSSDGDDDDDDDFSRRDRHRRRRKGGKDWTGKETWLSSTFRMMERHPTAPEDLTRWFRLGINVFLACLFLGVVVSIVRTIYSDVNAANEAATQEIRVQMAACQDEYIANGCATTNAPAFKKLCSEWYECMMQNPESIIRIRATMTEVAHIMNDFFGNLNLKAWGTFMAILLILVFANNTAVGKSAPAGPSSAIGTHPSSQTHNAQMPRHSMNDVMWIPVPTPKMRSRHYLGDDTDTDGTPPQRFYPPRTPSGRHSPSKRERSISPIKLSRSPTKDF